MVSVCVRGMGANDEMPYTSWNYRLKFSDVNGLLTHPSKTIVAILMVFSFREDMALDHLKTPARGEGKGMRSIFSSAMMRI